MKPAFVFSFALMAVSALSAQNITGSISGSVVDPTGLTIGGAGVSLTRTATATARDMKSDDRGAFAFSALPPGEYLLVVRQPGFKTAERRGIMLTAAETLSLGEVTLQLGDVADKVTVTAEGAVVQLGSAERSGVITASQVENIPIRGRNVTSLVQLLPGVVLLGEPEALSRAFNFSVQGNNNQFNTVALDGALLSSMDVQTPTISQDAIAEVKVLLTNYQAEYGRLAGANVQLVSKSGTRDFHGLGSWFKRHEQWNANEFFNNRLGRPRSPYRYNTWNYNVGGPLYIPGKFNRNRDKLFFFWSQEGWPLKTSAAAAQRTVPTELERAGDFSRTFDLNGALIPIMDPTTRQPFPNNRIPSNRLNPNGTALLKVFPMPNFTDTVISQGRYNYVFQADSANPLTTQTLKIDYPIDSKNLLFGNFTWSTEQRTGSVGIGGFNSSNWPQMERTTERNGKMIVMRYQRIINPRLVNELNFGYTNFPEHDVVTDEELRRNQRDPAGFTLGQFVPDANPLNIIPGATFGGVQNPANLAVERRLPQVAEQYTLNITNNITYNLSAHLLKAGVYMDTLPRASFIPLPFNGEFDFARNVNNPLDTNYAYSNAALGVFASYTEANQRVWYSIQGMNLEWYLQDTWKVTRRLTLDFGMRFYYIQPEYEANDQVSGFVPSRYDVSKKVDLIWPTRVNGVRLGIDRATGTTFPAALIGAIAPGRGDPDNGLVVAANDGTVPRAFEGNPGVKLGPRIGFALDPFGKGKTAVRGGFGLFYGRNQNRQTELFLGQAPIVRQPIVYYGSMSTLLGSAGYLFPPSEFARDFSGNLPTTMNFSLSVQQNVGSGIVVDAGYVGSLGRHQARNRNLNWIPFGANFRPENADPSNPASPLPPSFLRPYVGFADIPNIEYDATSNYHALEVTANRRFARGIQFGLAWTWSKAMDYGQGSNQTAGSISAQLSPRWFYSLSNVDRTHIVKINWVWDVPKMNLAWKPASYLINDWQLSGITSFISGAPTGVGFATTNAIDITGSPTESARIVVTGNPVLPKSERTFSRNFRTDVFQRPAVGTIGNAARTLLRGPGVNNWDIVLVKVLPITERFRAQLRCEAYNAFNHTQFNGLDAGARFDAQGQQVNPNFGAFTSAAPARRLQLAIRVTF